MGARTPTYTAPSPAPPSPLPHTAIPLPLLAQLEVLAQLELPPTCPPTPSPPCSKAYAECTEEGKAAVGMAAATSLGEQVGAGGGGRAPWWLCQSQWGAVVCVVCVAAGRAGARLGPAQDCVYPLRPALLCSTPTLLPSSCCEAPSSTAAGVVAGRQAAPHSDVCAPTTPIGRRSALSRSSRTSRALRARPSTTRVHRGRCPSPCGPVRTRSMGSRQASGSAWATYRRAVICELLAEVEGAP